MNVLIVDSNFDLSDWGSKDLNRLASQQKGATFYTRRAPQRDLPQDPSAFDRIILSGSRARIDDSSTWIEDLISFVKTAVEKQIPTLGVCFGHQILARAFGGLSCVGPSSSPELGWTPIQKIQESPLLKDLPRNFVSFSHHFDEIRAVPPGFEIIAQSDRCELQAIQMKNRPVYGVQFHPEKREDALNSIAAELRSSKNRSYLYPNTNYSPDVGEKIFSNFLEPPGND